MQKSVKEKYSLVGIRPGKYNFKGFGEIDLNKISLAKADSLVANGFPFLIPVGTDLGKKSRTAKKIEAAKKLTAQKEAAEKAAADIAAEQAAKEAAEKAADKTE